MEIKLECQCGTRFEFDVEPVNGCMPVGIGCPSCGLDGTTQANDLIAQRLGQAAPPPPVPPPAPARLRIASSQHASTPPLTAAAPAYSPALADASDSPVLSDSRSFDSVWINVLAPPLVALLAVLIQHSFLSFFLTGFHVWVHEFGHATVAWLAGWPALPLPIGWTNIVTEKSVFVYLIVLFLLAKMFVVGARERKIWPMILAVGIALLQAAMTWCLPKETARMWIAFAGVGGEFYLSAAMMALFYVQMPEKFKWSICRYFFLFIGAGIFYKTYAFWKQVKSGKEGIPYGSMIHGEDDAGGDMNTLCDDFGWAQYQIINTYNHLADVCLVGLIAVYVVFALRFDRMAVRLLARWHRT